MNEVYINIKEFGDDSWLRKFLYKKLNKDLISVDDLLGVIEDLKCDVEYLEEELQDLKEDIEDNYRPVSRAEQYE